MSKRTGQRRKVAILIGFGGLALLSQVTTARPASSRPQLAAVHDLISFSGVVESVDPLTSTVVIGDYQVYVADALSGLDVYFQPDDVVDVVGSEFQSTGLVWATSVRLSGDFGQKSNVEPQKHSITGTGKLSITGTGLGTQSITGTGVAAQSITGTGIRTQSITGTGRSSTRGTGVTAQSITGTGIRAQSITGTGRLSGGTVTAQSITGTGIRAQSITGTGRLRADGAGYAVQSITGTGIKAESITGTGVRALRITGPSIL
jgi:hypothetical protein